MNNALQEETQKFLDKYGDTFRQLAANLTEMVDQKDGDALFLSRHLLRIVEANITAVLGNDPDPVNKKGMLADLKKFVSFN